MCIDQEGQPNLFFVSDIQDRNDNKWCFVVFLQIGLGFLTVCLTHMDSAHSLYRHSLRCTASMKSINKHKNLHRGNKAIVTNWFWSSTNQSTNMWKIVMINRVLKSVKMSSLHWLQNHIVWKSRKADASIISRMHHLSTEEMTRMGMYNLGGVKKVSVGGTEVSRFQMHRAC